MNEEDINGFIKFIKENNMNYANDYQIILPASIVQQIEIILHENKNKLDKANSQIIELTKRNYELQEDIFDLTRKIETLNEMIRQKDVGFKYE